MLLKLDILQQAMELYKVYISHDLGMTLTYFMVRSTLIANAFEWAKLVKCNCIGETCWEYANGQKIYVYEKMSSGSCLPMARAIYIHMIIIIISNIIFSETVWPIKAKLYVEHR